MTQAGTALVHLEVSEPAPGETAAGSEFVLRVRASCAAGRDRTGMTMQIVAPDDAVTTSRFITHDGAGSETGDITLHMPQQLGDHVWRLALPAHDIAGVHHDKTSLTLAVRSRPHETFLAVWAVPSPVVAGERFAIKAGAKSSAGCELAGSMVEIRDAEDAVIGSGTLGETPWPGTSALYWTEIELPAPAREGIAALSARFDPATIDLPHGGSTAQFGIAVVPPPEHRLTVTVVEKDTATPIEDVVVHLGAYRATTGQAGLAQIRMPKGIYELHLWKVGYEAPPRTVAINDDVSIYIEALTVTEEEPDARWKM